MMKKAVLIGLMGLVGFGCNKAEDPVDIHEEETITTVRLTFVEQGNPSNTFTRQFADPDGDGGNAPSIDTLYLETNKTYMVSVEFWNESETPAVDLTAEILAEANEHFVCYEAMGNFSATFTSTDQDANGLPIGLESTWALGATTNGDFKITLKHQPDVKDGTCAPGDTDVEAVFPVVVI